METFRAHAPDPNPNSKLNVSLGDDPRRAASPPNSDFNLFFCGFWSLQYSQSAHEPSQCISLPIFQFFYAIKEIEMGGRCLCHGHAETCDILDEARPNRLLCRCQHHTCGKSKSEDQKNRIFLFYCIIIFLITNKLNLAMFDRNFSGDQCSECCPGFVQKKWRPSREGEEFECERESKIFFAYVVNIKIFACF